MYVSFLSPFSSTLLPSNGYTRTRLWPLGSEAAGPGFGYLGYFDSGANECLREASECGN